MTSKSNPKIRLTKLNLCDRIDLSKERKVSTMKKWTITLILVVVASALSATIGTLAVKGAHSENWYSTTAVVTAVSTEEDTVTIKDFNGLEWTFNGVEDWEEGDIASCLMNTNGTGSVKDDTIIKIQYSGYLEGWN